MKLSVRLYLVNHIPNFTKFSVHAACDRGLVLFDDMAATSCTSGFVNDVIFYVMARRRGYGKCSK